MKRLIATVLRVTQAVSPGLAAALAERLFFHAPQGKVSARGKEFLDRGKRFDLAVDGRRVVGWTWGEGPATYLVHGWGGSTGRLYSLGEALIGSGRRLVMFDAPGHGESATGLSSMPEFARSLQSVVRLSGDADVIIAHSLGAAATALAASWGVTARRFVFLAPAANPADWAKPFGKVLGLSPTVLQRLRSRSEHRLRFSWDDLDARVHARRMTAPLLVIHDRDDTTVPLFNGSDIASAWPGASLVETTGLGHTDLLRDPAVIARVLEFIEDQRTQGEPAPRVQSNTTPAT
jgi:pimeloyl-ACP methyl ester carboxylesterase